MPLHVLSYLAPSLPEQLFEALAGHLAGRLGTDVRLSFDPSRSGPRPGETEPFSGGDVDVAFVCATSYVWLTTGTPAVDLAGAAWVPTDPRAAGRPVYFGDVLTGRDGPDHLTGLAGRRVAYNDDVSLSGYHSLRLALTEVGVDPTSVELVRSGSHLASLDLLAAGEVEAAAIDSNVWGRCAREDAGLAARLRAVAGLGPHPVQPPVVRTDLDATTRTAVRDALLSAHEDDEVAGQLERAGFRRFVGVHDAHYHGLREQMAAIGVDGAVVS